MKVTVDDDLYEPLVIDYQITEIARLSEVLRKNGIDDAKKRRAICAEFAESNGTFLDQGWLSGEAGKHFIELHFSTREVDSEGGLGDVVELVVPEYASNFHEYVSGGVEYYFDEESEGLGDIAVGYP